MSIHRYIGCLYQIEIRISKTNTADWAVQIGIATNIYIYILYSAYYKYLDDQPLSNDKTDILHWFQYVL